MDNCAKHGPYSVFCRMCDLKVVGAVVEIENRVWERAALIAERPRIQDAMHGGVWVSEDAREIAVELRAQKK